jgi:gamma-glutamylcyclotransferase (GGCT)/AIG2-like uncharacterized protein YtfP
VSGDAIFVYGLLKPGLRLFPSVEPFVVRSARGTAHGRLYAAAYPAARFDEDGEIDGYVLWLDGSRLDEALRMLDDVEDEGEMYERRTIEVRTDEGAVEAFAYHWLLALDGCPDVGRVWPAKPEDVIGRADAR